jgi:hypothetical protein
MFRFIFHSYARVLATLLNGLSLTTGGTIISTDGNRCRWKGFKKQINDNAAIWAKTKQS